MKMKNKKILAAAAIAAIALTTGCSNPEKAGVEAMKKGDYEEAKTEFEKAVQDGEGKEAAEAYRGIGLSCYEQKDYGAALEGFQNAVDCGAAQTVQLYNLMGICAMQTEDYASALEHFGSGLALSEAQDADTDKDMIREMEYNQIVCYEKTGDWENAGKKADEYLAKYPDDKEMQKEAEFLKTR